MADKIPKPDPLALAIMFAIDTFAFHAERADGSAWKILAHYDDEVSGCG